MKFWRRILQSIILLIFIYGILGSLIPNRQQRLRLPKPKSSKGKPFQALCNDWYKKDTGPPTDIEHCPPTRKQAEVDPRFRQDDSTEGLSHFHRGAVVSFRQTTPNAAGSGQQCVYAANGTLNVGAPYGSSADLWSPSNPLTSGLHEVYDVITWEYCCDLSKSKASCAKYFVKRPSDDGKLYQPPASKNVVG